MSLLSPNQRISRLIASFVALLLALAIPISTALDNILLAILLLTGIFAYQQTTWQLLRRHPVARANALLFAALLVGCTYGSTSIKEAIAMLGKYIDLAFIPLLLVIFSNEKLRQRAWHIFLGVMVMTALLSWLVGLGVMPVQLWMIHNALPEEIAADPQFYVQLFMENPAIFRSSITQNILMAYAAYVFLLRAYYAKTPQVRWWWLGFAVFTGLSVLFLVQGRTGYLVLFGMLLWLGMSTLQQKLQERGKKFTIWHGVVMIIVLLPLLWLPYQAIPRLHQRVDMAIAEFNEWHPHGGQETSIGERLEFYYNTSAIVLQHPLIGVGTGGFSAAYAKQVSDSHVMATNNPHNEYLHLTVQLGAVGGLLLLYLFLTQWRTALQLGDNCARDAAIGLLITLALTSLFNTPLMDQTEGLFFAYMSALCFASYTREERHG